MKERWFILYSWGTTIAWYVFIWFASSITRLDYEGFYANWIINSIGYQLAYALLFLLVFRSILVTLRLKVERLMYWKSKREKAEDQEFAKVVELLIMLLTFSLCIILAIVDEYHQTQVFGRIASIEDLMVAAVGMILAAFSIFAAPIIPEIEARLAKIGKK